MTGDLVLRFPWTTLGNAALFVLLVVGFAVVGSFFGTIGVIAGIAAGTALALKSFDGGMDEDDTRSADGSRDCPECGRSNDPVANYCQHCGTELPVHERGRVAELRTRGAFRYCGNCGARVRDEPESCPGCGREFV